MRESVHIQGGDGDGESEWTPPCVPVTPLDARRWRALSIAPSSSCHAGFRVTPVCVFARECVRAAVVEGGSPRTGAWGGLRRLFSTMMGRAAAASSDVLT